MIKAKFTNKTKEAIYERDWYCCIICGNNTSLHFHHCKFGTDSNYSSTRNDVSEWVTICANHHLECHWCSKWEGARQECIDYLNNL